MVPIGPIERVWKKGSSPNFAYKLGHKPYFKMIKKDVVTEYEVVSTDMRWVLTVSHPVAEDNKIV